jgi:hypothetical protein
MSVVSYRTRVSAPIAGLLLVAVMITPREARAETGGETGAETGSDAAGALTAAPTGPVDVDELREALEAERRRSDDLEARLEEVELRQFEEIEAEANPTSRLLAVYGFFDLSFGKTFLDDGSPYALLYSDNSSFFMSNVNVYLKSEMSPTLAALVELRFSFLPHGDVEGQRLRVETPTRGMSGPQFETVRVDTSVEDPFTFEVYELGGVAIERAHLTWAPFDWLGVSAGRFLTPYGIWNIDHGSPVITTIRLPYMLLQEFVPRAQTGVQVFGRWFATDRFVLDYALTVSNGRGPIESVMDLDENKGLGARLRFSWDLGDVHIAFGGHGYYGRYTDRETLAVITYDADGQFSDAAGSPIRSETETHVAYDETVLSADLLIEAFGFRLQGEHVWRHVDYTVPPEARYVDALFLPGGIGAAAYAASFVGEAFYVLLSYDLPLERWIAPMRITPYAMFERTEYDDTQQSHMKPYVWIVGVNLRPIPSVAIKLEWSLVDRRSDFFEERVHSIAAQMAVAF